MLPNYAYDWTNGKYQLWDSNPPSSAFTIGQGTNIDGYAYGAWPGGKQLAPYSQDWNSGYDAVATDGRYSKDTNGNWVPDMAKDTTNTVWASLLGKSNSNLCNQQYYVPLLVDGVQVDLSISGSSAQSRATRDFYPHNIVIPSFTISGQCYSTAQYGAMAEYIHMAQHRALNNSDLIQFYLEGTADTLAQGTFSATPKVTYRDPNGHLVAQHLIQKIVGRHGRIIAQGYINTFMRSHSMGDHRPTWQIQFIVSNMLSSPIYTDAVVTEKETDTWLRILHGTQKVPTRSQNWLTQQNQKNNKKTLRSVGSSSVNSIQGITQGLT